MIIQKDINNLLITAWYARDKAIARKTKVGAAVLTISAVIFDGCNIEHDYCRSFHAEEVAIMKAVSSGYKKIIAIAIVAELEQFTPCGTCRDWISQFMDWNGQIIIQANPNKDYKIYTMEQLYPFKPQK